MSDWFFNIASSLVLATVITLVTRFVLGKRPDLEPDPDAELDDIAALRLSGRERSAMRLAGAALLVAVGVLFAFVLPESSPLRGENGSIVESPLLDGIAAVVAFLFGTVDIVYGKRTGTIAEPADVPKLMVEGLKQMAPVLVLFFAIAQFLAYFDSSHVDDVLSVKAAELLKTSGVPVVVVFLLVLVLLTVVNIFVTSASAMWSIAAPVLVPMLLLVDVPAETTQALFHIADSESTAITPMSPTSHPRHQASSSPSKKSPTSSITSPATMPPTIPAPTPSAAPATMPPIPEPCR